jgi:hypothetical protein
VEEDLKEAQELNKLLSIYKNQEYPEKLLQINNLRRKLSDLNTFYAEEKESLQEMIKNDRNQTKQSQLHTTLNISEKISSVGLYSYWFG